MDDANQVDRDLWQTFLARHVISVTDQEAFLDYLTRPQAPTVDTLADLEAAYRRFLRLGPPPLDIH